MKKLNSVIIVGTFVHFTSKKGAKNASFLLETNKQCFPVSMPESLSKALVSRLKRGSKVSIIGKLSKVGKNVTIFASHISLEEGHENNLYRLSK